MASTATAPCTAQPLHAPPAAAGSRRRGDRRLLAPGLHRFHLDLHPRCRPLLPARMCLSGTCPHQQEGQRMLSPGRTSSRAPPSGTAPTGASACRAATRRRPHGSLPSRPASPLVWLGTECLPRPLPASTGRSAPAASQPARMQGQLPPAPCPHLRLICQSSVLHSDPASHANRSTTPVLLQRMNPSGQYWCYLILRQARQPAPPLPAHHQPPHEYMQNFGHSPSMLTMHRLCLDLPPRNEGHYVARRCRSNTCSLLIAPLSRTLRTTEPCFMFLHPIRAPLQASCLLISCALLAPCQWQPPHSISHSLGQSSSILNGHPTSPFTGIEHMHSLSI